MARADGATAIPRTYLLLLAAWMFDFQSDGEAQGIAIQAVFLAIYLVALGLFLLNDTAAQQRVRGMGALLASGMLFLLVSTLSAMLDGQPPYQILRNALNVFVYLTSAYVTARTVMTSDARQLRLMLGLACLIYAAAFLVIYATTQGGIDLARVRHQIIGTSSIAALGYIVLSLLFRLTWLELAAMGINAAILLTSVTRTFLLAFAAQALVVIVEFRRALTPRLALVGLAGLAIAAVTRVYGEQQVQRWEARLAGSGSNFPEYQSFYTRISEWEFMARAWTSSPGKFLFGSGIAAPTRYFNAPQLHNLSESMVGFGHNQHLALLFTGGVIGGLPLLVLQWRQGGRAFSFLRRTIRFRGVRHDLIFLGAWGAIIILGTLAANLLGNSYALRGTALWYGIGTGLLLGVQARYDHANSHQKWRI